MGPKPPEAQSGELFRQPLIEQLNGRHPLVRLAAVIDWQEIERTFGAHFASTTGRPALPPRLVAGLLYLQHAYDCSDEAAVNTWVETRTGNTSRARPGSRQKYPSIRRASRGGESASARKASRRC